MENMFNKDFYSAPIESLSDKFIFGGAMLLIGMITVFAVLALLWLCLVLFRIAFQRLSEKSSQAKVDSPITEESAPVAVPSNADEEIVAVIAAAIAMAESEASGMKFRVVSFKRK